MDEVSHGHVSLTQTLTQCVEAITFMIIPKKPRCDAFDQTAGAVCDDGFHGCSLTPTAVHSFPTPDEQIS